MTTTSPAASQTIDGSDLAEVADVAQQIRVDGIRASTRAGSGHPTSSMSAADLIAVLAAKHLRYDWDRPHLASNDHLIFSKGHASPLLYGLYKACGVVSDEELMTYRTLGSRLQGHPTPVLPWVDVATGSLGQGLPIAVGVALAGKYLDKIDFHTWVLCGDSELAEGSIWEALDKASHFSLGNLTAIFDINRLGQRGPTEYQWDLDVYRKRVEAFGCEAIVINGHDHAEIDAALGKARKNSEQPTVVIAKTIKGYGFSEIADKDGWHGKTLPPDMRNAQLQNLEANATCASPSPNPPSRLPRIRITKLISRFRSTRRKKRWRRAKPSATACARSACDPTSLPSTPRSATPRTLKSSPKISPTATSKSLSPSSR